MPRRLSPSIAKRLAETVLVVFGYTVAAVVATWPLARHPLGGIYGFPNDNYGGIWLYGFLSDAYHGAGSASFASDLQAPFGLEISQQGLQPVDRFMAYFFGGPGQGLGAYNLQIFASFVLAGCTMYLLARYVTGNRTASALAGFIFAFSPFHLAQAMQYTALSSIQWIPLYLLTLLVLLRRGRWRDAVFTGGAFALITATSYYHAWFVAWITVAVLIVWGVGQARSERATVGRISPARARDFSLRLVTRGGLAMLIAIAVTLPLVRSSVATLAEPVVGSRSIEEAIRYSARPWMLLIPPHDNPFFGGLTRGYVQTHLFEAPVIEQSIYIGYTVLILVGLALWRPWRRFDLSKRISFSRPLAVGGAIMGLVIMLGPYVPLDGDYWRLWAQPGETLHVPSLGRVMFEIASVFRFSVRAFVIVSACLALLAAIGLTRLHRRFPTQKLRAAATVAAFTVIAVEFANVPPTVFAKETASPWVGAVASLPVGSSIAQYPLATEYSPRSVYYLYWQRRHQKATINPPHRPEAQALMDQIRTLDGPTAGRVLGENGIDYVVVHTSLPPPSTIPYQPGLPPDAMPRNFGSLSPWLERYAALPDAVIYRVRQTPKSVVGATVTFADGWGGSEPGPTGSARWLDSPEGALTVVSSGTARPLAATLRVISFVRRRTVSVTLDDRVIGRFDVPTDAPREIRLDLGVVAPGVHRLLLRPTPGGDQIGAVLKNDDKRVVSLYVSDDISISG